MTPESRPTAAPGALGRQAAGDRVFKWLTLLMALTVIGLIFIIGCELAYGSQPALRKFGWRFLTSTDWDPVNEQFGALPFIFGTVVSSAIALVIRRAAEHWHGHLSDGVGPAMVAPGADALH